MYRLKFVLQGVEREFDGGTLAQACAAAGWPLDLVCGGRGTCGKCRVQVDAPGLPTWVRACGTAVDRDMSVWLEEAQLTRQAAIATEGAAGQAARLAPSVSHRCFTRAELLPVRCGAWLKEAPLDVLQHFSRLAADRRMEKMTFTYFDGVPITVEGGDHSGRLYGGAVDIGTTSVVLYVYDLLSGVLLSTQSELNGQISYGADVISRIQHAVAAPGGVEALASAVRSTLERLFTQAAGEVEDLREHLFHLVICGNSTMQQLFLGLTPAGLAQDPFVNVTAEAVQAPAAWLGLGMAPGGQVTFLPLLGGFVGADTAAVLLTMPDDGHLRLVVDLGTNGEIGVGDHTGWHVASTACGPALEGGSIKCGMRGTNGAIERVDLENGRVRVRVIGGGAPVGLCGSAIIDAVAELCRTGLVDETGRLLSRNEFLAEHPDSPLAGLLFEVEVHNWAFRLAGDIYLSQADIRQVQLAKSAIYAGCVTLLAERELGLDDVYEVVLAGAFGSYVDIGRALAIGLLPPFCREKVYSVGNGAGKGVQLCLLDRDQLARCGVLAKRAKHVELASNPRFMEEYILNMGFPDVAPPPHQLLRPL